MGEAGSYDLTTPVFGEADAEERTRLIGALLRERLGSDVDSQLFWHESIGIVAGFALTDGRRAVVKIFQPDITVRFLESVEVIRRQLFAVGFPCAEPLGGPFPLGDGSATVERFEEVVPVVDPTSVATVRSVAATLAQLVGLGADLEPGHLEALDAGGPWRTDYSSEPWDVPDELDFLRLAVPAAQELYEPATAWTRTVGHGDWRMPNMSFNASGEVAAVFDWDSLLHCTEAWTVGVAASMFSAGAGGDRNARPPSLSDSSRFIDEYERARGRAFSDGERKAVAGALLYSLAEYAWGQFDELKKAVGDRREWLAGGRYMDMVRDQWKAYVALGVRR